MTRSDMIRIAACFAAVVPWIALTAALEAQDIQVVVQEPPLYVGEPAVVRLVARGFDEQPEPQCQAPASSPNLRASIASLQPNVSSSVRIVTDPTTGRRNIQETKTVVYVIDYHVTADAAGSYALGPFRVTQGNQRAQANAVTLTFQDVPLDPDMRIQLILPDRPVYPDQRVPVTVQWSYAGDFEAVHKLRIYSPLFDMFDFAPDKEPSRRGNLLPIETKDGQVALAAEVRREIVDGREFAVVSAKRTLIPNRPGEYALRPITATLRKVTQWARVRSPFDDFGFGGSMFDDLMGDRRRAAKTALARAVGRPQTLVVKPFPPGQPESFAGAVGSGFSLDVTADRTVVRVGDPIRLTLKLHGAGNLRNASLPSLAADGGLDPERFRLPEGDLSGTYQDGTKTFEVTVRVQSQQVSAIPALAYSWFDPTTAQYETTRSKPIALRVMPTTIVSADDVIRADHAKGRAEQPPDAAPTAPQPDPPGVAGSRPAFSLIGADLSVEYDVSKLLRDQSRPPGGFLLQVSVYLVGALIVLVAWVDRKRRDRPQEAVARRKLLRAQRRLIEQARNRPQPEASEQIAAALRRMIAAWPSVVSEAAQPVIARCESVIYAPQPAADGRPDETLVRDALAVADRFIEEAE